MELWAEGWCECPHSRTAAVQELNGMRPVKNKKKKVRKVKVVVYPGITGHAEALGCTRPHLWKVLTGRRVSRSLTARYHALVAAGGE